MRRIHPDVVRDPELAEWSTARARELNEVMELLGDPVRRATYDRASSPVRLAVYDVSPEIDVEEGDRPVVRFKVDCVEGSVPAGSELVFSAAQTSKWLRVEPLTVRSIRDDKPFPVEVELSIDAFGIPLDTWLDGEIEVKVREARV